MSKPKKSKRRMVQLGLPGTGVTPEERARGEARRYEIGLRKMQLLKERREYLKESRRAERELDGC